MSSPQQALNIVLYLCHNEVRKISFPLQLCVSSLFANFARAAGREERVPASHIHTGKTLRNPSYIYGAHLQRNFVLPRTTGIYFFFAEFIVLYFFSWFLCRFTSMGEFFRGQKCCQNKAANFVMRIHDKQWTKVLWMQ